MISIKGTQISIVLIFAAHFLAAVSFPQSAQADPNGWTKFAIRNCTSQRVYVCSFDKTDSLMYIPYHSSGIKPGKKKDYSCASDGRCKVTIGISEKSAKKLLSNDELAGAAVAVGALSGVGAGLVGGSMAASSIAGAVTVSQFWSAGAATGLTAATTTVTVGTMAVAAGAVAIGAGVTVAVIKTIDGLKAGELCKKVKKAQMKVVKAIVDDGLRKAAKKAIKQSVKGKSGLSGRQGYKLGTVDGKFVLKKGNKCSTF